MAFCTNSEYHKIPRYYERGCSAETSTCWGAPQLLPQACWVYSHLAMQAGPRGEHVVVKVLEHQAMGRVINVNMMGQHCPITSGYN